MTSGTVKPRDVGFDRQFSANVNGVPTEIVFHCFANKWFLVITQLGKIPGMYNVHFDVHRDERVVPCMHGPVDNPEFHVSVPITMNCCLGLDTDETRSAIQFLVNRTGLHKCPTEFVVGLGLKQIDGPNLRALAKVLEEAIF
ncbi:uncharacterized protein LOC108111172 [Drosophila eugracilis]|uniref:uncharacterized protein LOC108111172 n=1 Tax=Drosophila eugracilis TaxID=29029 RepID=UPI001BDA6005|nr:uncharacterized protein LOC108111172 [Drosophila eugracilis]